jgi:hypothetical protein
MARLATFEYFFSKSFSKQAENDTRVFRSVKDIHGINHSGKYFANSRRFSAGRVSRKIKISVEFLKT